MRMLESDHWCGGSEVRIICAAISLCGLLNQSHTRINNLLVPFDSEVRKGRPPRNDANFGIGTLTHGPRDRSYSGSSGSRRALRRALVADGEVDERVKHQRIETACRVSCRITIWAVRRGPSLPARNTLSSRSTVSSSASKVQTSRFGSTSMTPRASDRRLAFTDGCR